MKNKKIIDMVQAKNMVIPLYLYKHYPKLNIELNDFIFLMYLYNEGNRTLFDPNRIEKDLGWDLKDIMTSIGKLVDQKLIDLEVRKNDNGEYITYE